MGKLARTLTFTSFLVLLCMVLAAVGQPIFTDDTWWHLALGRAYATQGPWLAADPLLFTAPGPPAPAAWLADLLLHEVDRWGGFPTLRIVHVATAAAIVTLVWTAAKRASGSRQLACVATAIFVCLSTYRLVQLRPHLFSMLAALLLYRGLFSHGVAPTRRQIAMSCLLLMVWANVHAAFVLGPAIIAVGLLGLLLQEATKPAAERDFGALRIRRVALALVLGSLATGINPAGIEPHFAYLIAGSETPSLSRVGDEWASMGLFAVPGRGAIPNPLDWTLVWVLLLASAAALIHSVVASKRNGMRGVASLDFVTLGLSVMSFIAMILAVRFVWLSVFPILFLVASRRATDVPAQPLGFRTSAAISVAMLTLTIAFFTLGNWPSISRGLPHRVEEYARDYPSDKYHGHAVWFLRDARLAGNLFAEYYMGGFLGYWVAPELRTFINGSLNVSQDAVDANLPIRERRGARPGETFLELLDRQEIELFLGIRLPRAGSPGRPWFHTTAHLESAPGWIPIFRNLNSAVYLRDIPANAENLQRAERYYRDRGIAFDASSGFEPERVIDETPGWAIAHGLAPHYFAKIAATVNDRSSPKRLPRLDILSEIYAALGVYDRTIAIDRELLAEQPGSLAAQRRLTWSLLRSGDFEAAGIEAARLQALAATDGLSQAIVFVAERAVNRDRDWTGEIARLAVFSRREASRISAGMVRPETRVFDFDRD